MSLRGLSLAAHGARHPPMLPAVASSRADATQSGMQSIQRLMPLRYAARAASVLPACAMHVRELQNYMKASQMIS